MGRERYGRLQSTVRALLHGLVDRGSSLSQRKPYPPSSPLPPMRPPREWAAATPVRPGRSNDGGEISGTVAAGWAWRLLPAPGIANTAGRTTFAAAARSPSTPMDSPVAPTVSARSAPPPRPGPPSSAAPPPPDPPPPPPSADAWAYQGVSCSLALLGGGAEGPSEVGGGRMRIAAAAAGVWWELRCGLVDGQGRPINETAGGDGGGGGGESAGRGVTAAGGLRVRPQTVLHVTIPPRARARAGLQLHARAAVPPSLPVKNAPGSRGRAVAARISNDL